MKPVSTIIIGAGQSGLAMSRQLMQRGVDHVLVDRGAIADTWRTQRWDSLRLLTPNWANCLLGDEYQGPDPDGYMDVAELVTRLEGYAHRTSALIYSATQVHRVCRSDNGYKLETSQGPLHSRTVVLATGAFVQPVVPALRSAVPGTVHQTTPNEYKRPGDLPEGGVLVVGAAATGVQLARELQASGRQVTLSIGGHIRLPRTYRGHDIEWWLHAIGLANERFDAVDDLERARRLPSPQLIGGPDPVDLNALQECGVEIVGRIAAIRDGQALFSGGLRHLCASADLKMHRLLDAIDAWITEWDLDSQLPATPRPAPTRLPVTPRLSRSLVDGGIRSILWATGFRPDFSWLDVPVFDRRGRLRHHGGVVDAPGLYVLGLPILRRRQSHQISGVGHDAAELSSHLRAHLDGRASQAA